MLASWKWMAGLYLKYRCGLTLRPNSTVAGVWKHQCAQIGKAWLDFDLCCIQAKACVHPGQQAHLLGALVLLWIRLRQYWNLIGANTWSLRCEALTQCHIQGLYPHCIYHLPGEMLQTLDHIQCSDAVRALSLTAIWGHGLFREYNESVSLLPGRRITLGYQCWGTLLGVFFLESPSPCSPGVFLLWELSVTQSRGKSVLFPGRHREKRSKSHGLPPALPNWCSCAYTRMCPGSPSLPTLPNWLFFSDLWHQQEHN